MTERQPRTPAHVHPIVRGAVPRRSTVLAIVLAWLQAAALSGAFIAAGRIVDLLAIGDSPGTTALLLAACVVVAAAAAAVDAVRTSAAQAAAERTLRTGVVASILRGGIVRAGRSGVLLSLATDAVERSARYRATFLGPIIGSFTTPFVVLAVYAATVDPLIAGVLAVLVLVVPVIIMLAQRAVRRSGAENRREKARLAAAFLTNVQGLGALVGAGAAERAGQALAAQGERHRRTLMRMLARNQVLILITDATVSFGIVLIAVLLAVLRHASGDRTLGEAVATILVALLVIRPVDAVGQFFYIGIGGRAAERALTERLDGDGPPEPEPAAETDAHAEAGIPPAAIELSGVTAGWLPGRAVIRDFSLRVDPGEHVALVGPSGVGKSTVAALVQAQLLADAGEVRVGEVLVSRDSARRARSLLAVVEQRTFLFHGTVADNLLIAAPRASEKELWRALAAAGLETEIRALPDGLGALVGEHGLKLSGGQAQRVAIARAFLRDAPVLVLDEPTSQVDLAGEAAFLAALERLAGDRTVLTIAHRPGAVLAADRVVRLTRTEGD